MAETPATGTPAFRGFLVGLGVAILEAQPAMAPLVTLASRVLGSFRADDMLEDARTQALEAVDTFEAELCAASAKVATQGGTLLPERSTIITLSSSSTVRATLERFGAERSLRVICLESRPMREGVHMARFLAEAGVDVTVAVDASSGTLIREADMVLLGADSAGDRGIVNKIGSLALLSLARDRGIPVHVLLDKTKFLPPGFPQTIKDDRPSGEVADEIEGARIWNRYFELIPMDEVASIVTESGYTSPSEVEDFRSRIQVPPELQAWAKARSR